MNLELGITRNYFSGHFYNIISELQTEKELENKLYYKNQKKNKYYLKHYNKDSIGIRKIGHLIIQD